MLSSDASLFGFCCNVIRSFVVQTDFSYSTTALMQLVRALNLTRGQAALT